MPEQRESDSTRLDPGAEDFLQRLAAMDPEERKQYLVASSRFWGPVTANVKAMSPEQRKHYERNLKLWPKYYAAKDSETKKKILDEILGGKSDSEYQQEDTPSKQRERRSARKDIRQRIADMSPEERKQYEATVARFTGPITADVKAMSPEQRKRYERNLKLWPKYYAAEDSETKKKILDEILGGKSDSEYQQEDTPPVQRNAPPSFPELESCTGYPVNVEEMTPEQRKRYERNLKLWPKYYAAEDSETKKKILDEILGGKSDSEYQQEDTPPVQRSAPPTS